MYLYNISIIVEDNSHDALIDWVKNEWINNLPLESKFLKMLNNPHEGHTYCVQIIVSTEQQVIEMQSREVALLQSYIGSHHAEKAFIFDSVMQYLNK